MTKEFKQITMHIGDEYTTDNFKRGFEHLKKVQAKEFWFSWDRKKMRTTDDEFVARIKKILPNFIHTPVADMECVTGEHRVHFKLPD